MDDNFDDRMRYRRSNPAFRDWYPIITFAKRGCDPAWRGGFIRETGWYVEPYCTSQCCRPEGPFKTYDEALRWSRTECVDLNEETPFVPVGTA